MKGTLFSFDIDMDKTKYDNICVRFRDYSSSETKELCANSIVFEEPFDIDINSSDKYITVYFHNIVEYKYDNDILLIK